MTAIGVTGHRTLAELPRLEDGLEQVVRRMESVFPGEWTAVSALADGADRMVATRLMARDGTRLVAVLPLPRDEYATDFTNPASADEFHALLRRADHVVEVTPRASRDDAYEVGGLIVLDRCDVLVALWDGRGAQGHGGTGSIVTEARRRGLPVAWIHAGNRAPGTREPTSLGPEQGSVTFERFPDDPGPFPV